MRSGDTQDLDNLVYHVHNPHLDHMILDPCHLHKKIRSPVSNLRTCVSRLELLGYNSTDLVKMQHADLVEIHVVLYSISRLDCQDIMT